MRGLSALEVCNNNGWKIVEVANCLSRSGRPVPHSHKFVVRNNNEKTFFVLESYGSFVGATDGWYNKLVNDEWLWSATTKRAFGVKIDEIRERGMSIDEIVNWGNNLR